MRKLILIVLVSLVSMSGYFPGAPPAAARDGKFPPSNQPAPQAAAQAVSPASHCQYCISPFDKSFIFEEGNGSVTVTAPPGCAWTATSNDDFITITSGGSGSGNGVVTFTLEANPGFSRRVGSITLAGQTFTVLQGIQFNDVPSNHIFYNEIGKLSARGITQGCDVGFFCPDDAVTRQQMAAFIIRALGILNPPQPSSQRFADVPPSNPFYAFIEELAARQITLGCDGNNFCPELAVTRQQMAAFIIRALHEPGYVPPQPLNQRFADVPPSNPFFAHIEEMAQRQITLGCGVNDQGQPIYCPSETVTRGQMAAFLIRAFDSGINGSPVVSAGPDQAITLPSAASLNGFASDDGQPACSLTLLWSQVSGPGNVTFSDPGGETTTASFSAPGTYVLRLMASDFQHTGSDDLTITVNPINPGNQPPSVNAGPDQTLTLPAIASLSGLVTDDGVPSGNSPTASWNKVSGPGTVIFSNASATATTASFSEAGSYVLRLTGSDSILINGDEVTVTVNADPTPPPPDPETVAPPVNPTVTTTIGAATEFLYTGANPIQTGVAPGAINPVRAAVLRGRVKGKGGAPLSNVKITILNHPELGQTRSRADGMFDIAVNGDDLLTVRYEKVGFIPVQRQQRVEWQEYSVLNDVVMMEYDDRVTHIDLSAPIPIQVAQGSTSRDTDGARRAVLLFQQATTATMVLANGSTQPLTNLHVRATEYTVGPNGPEAMPGSLPPSSAYTYAVEYSLDEALAAGARTVLFNQPVMNYIDNFLDFPVGGVVPVGGYDREAVSWMPSANGRVIKILSIASGAAEMDTDGDGVADNGASLGVTLAERQALSGLYSAGQSLWRVPINHFSPWDCNWPYVLPSDAASPPSLPPPFSPADDPCEQSGSIIECQNQTLGERAGLIGTSFSLSYRSDRVVGQGAAYTMGIGLSGVTIPASLRRIELEVSVGGRMFTQIFAALPNQRATFTWTGRDVYGRVLQGMQPVTVRVGFVYPAIYREPSQFPSSFGDYGNSIVGPCQVWPPCP